MTIKQTIRNYIMENFLFTDDESALQNDTSFMAHGIIDSIGIMELVEFVEGKFNLKVNAKDILPENLDSVDKIVAFIERKQSAFNNEPGIRREMAPET